MHTERGGVPVGARERDTSSNTRVTAVAGMALLVLLAVQGVTIVSIHRLITMHFFVGFLLLGPLLLKLASTGYRFVRYYTGDPDYGRAGAPQPILRVAAPALVVLTLAVFGSGVALAFVRRGHAGPLLVIHKASFILWFGVTTLHVLAYAWRAATLTAADVLGRGPRAVVARRRTRGALLIASLGVGLGAAVVGLGAAHRWSGQ